MPAPFTTSHSAADTLAMRIASGNAKIAAIDAGAGAGYVAIFTSTDIEVVRKTLSDPCGTVNAGTGEVTINTTGAQSTSIAGTAAYSLVFDSDNVAHSYMECIQGATAVAGKMVLTNLAIGAGETLNWNNIIMPVA